MGPPLKRAKTPFIALWVLFWDVILVIVVGVIFGGICPSIVIRISLSYFFGIHRGLVFYLPVVGNFGKWKKDG